ncbi:hypothetical protein LSTR_LSTR003709 [Laodelphax striatellus]|uniref:Uncharacterized protein n=1 Tax=Laodelphax striatellus TaxID=195883 RepID=A0A482X0B4_LAOST|nr:hypothetical protein LSTR_LSTR003709 [Laodelphax striatellus]
MRNTVRQCHIIPVTFCIRKDRKQCIHVVFHTFVSDSASELHQVVRRKTASQSRNRAGFSQKPIYSSQHSVNNDSIDNIIIEDYFDQADTDQSDFALNLPTISEVGFEVPTTDKVMDLILVQSELEVKYTVKMMAHVPDEIEILGVSTEDKAIENVPDENELELLTTDETMAHIQVQSGFEVPTTDKAMDLKLVQGELEVKSTGEMMAHVPDEIEILGEPTVDKRIIIVSRERWSILQRRRYGFCFLNQSQMSKQLIWTLAEILMQKMAYP